MRASRLVAATFLEPSRGGEVRVWRGDAPLLSGYSSAIPTRPIRAGMRGSLEFVVKTRKSLVPFIFCPLTLALGSTASLAQEAPPKVGALVVTAARAPQALNEVLSDLTLIDREDIERSGAASLAELLQRVSSVEVTSNGGPGTASGVFLRGANTGHTLVLVDGLRVDSATLGGTTLEALPLGAIERIEILRGPASSLYGADALGGVIQIFTRRGEGPTRFDASLGLGSRGRQQVQAGAQGSHDAWRWALNAGVDQDRGFSAVRNGANYSFNPDRDGFRREHWNGRVEYRLHPQHEVALAAWASRLMSQFDGGPDFDDRTRSTLRGTSASYRGSPLAYWTMSLRAAQTLDDSVTDSSWGHFAVRTKQATYLWQNDLRLPLGELQLAYERREEKVASNTVYDRSARDTDALLVAYRLETGAQALQASLRHDDNSQYGAKDTGSLAYALRFAPGWRVTAAAGTGFKAPSFNDLYYPGFGNPALRPETAKNFEAGVKYAEKGWEIKALAFHNRVEELIVFMCDVNYNCAPANVARARLRGLSLGATWREGGFSLSGFLDVQQPEDADTGRWLPRRARQHGGLALAHEFGAWRLGAEWLASGRRYEDAANLRPMAGYGLLNLSASYRLSAGWSLLARVNNVFDRRYEIAKDYGTPGVNAFLALQYRS
ncbi:Vitamin B12 transporter BtuB [Burkholderiales bacterium]|nr:Vitamin B12 transporter BtuB [Burkholderiales bacterium]